MHWPATINRLFAPIAQTRVSMSPADGRSRRPGGRSDAKHAAGGRADRASSRQGSGPKASVNMTISSDYGDAREVQRLIREEVEKAGFDSDSQFAIKLALEEALINAIKHGNKLDKSKRVQVEWRVTPQVAEIEIEDEGPGFDRSNVPDPTQG